MTHHRESQIKKLFIQKYKCFRVTKLMNRYKFTDKIQRGMIVM